MSNNPVAEQTTLGPCALELGVMVHHVERVAERGKIPFTRAGRIRLVRVADYPVIRAALIEAGYLKVKPEACVA